MKRTLLDIVQIILSRLDSDEINSISDTDEAMQVARIVQNTYFNMLTRSDLPELKNLIQLTASGDNTKPVYMIRPDSVAKIYWVKYNKRLVTDITDRFEYVTILPLQQFLEMTDGLNTSALNVGSFVLNNITFYYRNDVAPTYCTIVDDVNIIFDSFDNTVENTLQTSKTKCLGLTIPAFNLIDTTIPQMDDVQFPLLVNEAAAVAFVDLKQQANPKAELESQRQWRSLQRTKALTKVPTPFDSFPYFGRK